MGYVVTAKVGDIENNTMEGRISRMGKDDEVVGGRMCHGCVGEE